VASKPTIKSGVLKFDRVQKLYYNELTWSDGSKTRNYEFCKSIKTVCLIVRLVEKLDLDLKEPKKVIYYSLPIEYKIKDGVKNTWLSWHYVRNPDDPEEDSPKYMRVYIHRFNSETPFLCSISECPIPNSIFELENPEGLPDLDIIVGKPKMLTDEEKTRIQLEGKSCGIFTSDLLNRQTT
jgi:hypothetical protein